MQNEPENPLRKVVDSTVAVAFARFVMPMALAVVGFLMVTSFNDLKSGNERLWTAFTDLSKTVAVQTTDIAVLKTQTAVVQKTVDQLSAVTNSIHRAQDVH